MRISRIEIENFKGISARQKIDLRPVTLLFGPNSAGKSTILQALHYLREILERGNIDPDRTIAGGLIDLGGFATMVHNHDLDQTITLKAVLDLSEKQGAEDLPLNAGLSIGEPEFAQLPVRYLVGESKEYRDNAIVQKVGLEVGVSWSRDEQTPYVSRLAIEMDGEPLAAIVSPPAEGHAQLTDFNFTHALLQRAVLPDDMPEENDCDFASPSPLEDEIRILAREAAADRSTPSTPNENLRISVGRNPGSLPFLERDLILDARNPEANTEVRTPRVNGLRSLLSELILGPTRLVRDCLVQMTYIGPMRETPKRRYRPQTTPDEGRWAHGLAAWDLLYNDRRGDLMAKVNSWLSGEKRFRTGYRLERVECKEIPVPSAMHEMFARGLNEDDIRKLQELYQRLQPQIEIALRDFEKDILVSPGDVGTGISQMIPVIVAALQKQNGILVIEQPELHVHPAVQVGMGDLFINAAASDPDNMAEGKLLIVETHSEHIMLRLLRRVRETTDDELPADTAGITPDDLSVIHVENRIEGVIFRPLRVSDDGDFEDRWPQGFFDERAEELF